MKTIFITIIRIEIRPMKTAQKEAEPRTVSRENALDDIAKKRALSSVRKIQDSLDNDSNVTVGCF